jgi:hypothetical protein
MEKHRVWVYENSVLSRVCGSKKNTIRECWRKLHDMELYKMYSSPNIIRTAMSRRWVVHVACMKEMMIATGF